MGRLASAALVGLVAALAAAGCGTQRYAAGTATSPRVGTESAPIDAALVTPSFGWVLAPDRLLVTRDGGATLTDAKVPLPAGWARAAYFHDAAHGVVAAADGRNVVLGRTNDGGVTWIMSTLTDAASWPTLRYSALRIAFGDTGHGVIMAKTATSPNFSRGTLFATTDGGGSWSARPAPVAGQVVVEPGGRTWLAGGVAHDQLYTSSDAGRHWMRSRIQPASGNGTVTVAPPMSGKLPVTVASGGTTQVGLFTTADNGRTWHESSRVAVHGKTGARVNVPVTRTDTGPLVIDTAGGHAYRFAAGHADIRPSGLPEGVYTAGFTGDGRNGWALATYGRCAHGKQACSLFHVLTATADSGATWKRIRLWTEAIG